MKIESLLGPQSLYSVRMNLAQLVLGATAVRITYRLPTCPPGLYQFGPGSLENLCDLFHFWSVHVGGSAHFLFADGSVLFSYYSSDSILPALATRAGGTSVVKGNRDW